MNLEQRQLDFDDRPMQDHTVKTLLETRADFFDDDPCLIYGPEDTTYSFDEVNRTCNAIANSLRKLGLKRGAKVSTMIDHQLYGVLSMYGIHKAGMVYAPINYEFQGETLSYQLLDVDSDLLIIEDTYVEKFRSVKDDLEELPPVYVLETNDRSVDTDDDFVTDPFDALLEGSRDDPALTIAWDEPASIIYTSGTTGHPKGVVVPYRWMIYYCAVRWQVMNREDVVHTSLPLYHGAGPYWDVFPALIVGSPVALWDKFSPSRFIERATKYEATTASLISVMHTWLWNEPEREEDHRNTLNKVQVSPLPEYHVAMAERFSFDFITSKFGQQESGNPLTGFVHAARGESSTPSDLQRGFAPDVVVERATEMGVPVVEEAPGERWIGKPMPWMEVAVFGDRDERLPAGEIGEMVCRPKLPSVTFDRYYNKPEKTLEEFSNLWFHVGDAVYHDEDGHFFYVDRIGHMIRRRGENISGEQLEDIALNHDAIDEVAVLGVPSSEGGEDDIAFVIRPKDGVSFTEADLREYLEPRVADFMLPTYVEFVDELPMTETNKVRKNELREDLFGE